MIDFQPPLLPLLKQGYRNNWQQYLAVLSGQQGAGSGRAPIWDAVVLTARDGAQAQVYRAELERRELAGQLGIGTRYVVIPDPRGRRIGSGGAMLRVLRALADEAGAVVDLTRQRVLVVHAGAASRHMPHCATGGKLFARLPHELPDGRASTVFDEFLVSLSGLPARVPPGVLVAWGDALALFDHTQLDFERPGVVAVATLADAQDGLQHAILVPDASGHTVDQVLHRPTLEQMRRGGALTPDGQALVDMGLVWLDWPTCQQMLAIEETLHHDLETRISLNFYSDVLLPLAASADRDAYLAQESRGQPVRELVNARECIWRLLRGTPFGVEQLHPAHSMRLGSTVELLDTVRYDVLDLSAAGWSEMAASSVPQDALDRGSLVAANALVTDSNRPYRPSNETVYVCDSVLETAFRPAGKALVANVQTQRARLLVPEGIAIQQLPLQGGIWVTRVYGIVDDPTEPYGKGTFCGRPWADWLTASGASIEDLWPDAVGPDEATLWTARLYPASLDRETSLEAALWLASPETANDRLLAAWRAAPRLSFTECLQRVDAKRLVADIASVEDAVAVQRFVDGLNQERPVSELAPLLASRAHRLTRARKVADRIEEDLDPWMTMRGYRALEIASAEPRWGERAFAAMARLMCAHMAHRTRYESSLANVDGENRAVEVRSAARIDLGGGWTDTPPYCLERGGAVLNAAIELNGDLPIATSARLTVEPSIVLENRDLDATLRPVYVGDLFELTKPGDPLAIHKAVVLARGIVPLNTSPNMPVEELCRRYGHGLSLVSVTNIPRGSGLGASGIVTATLLKALSQALGEAVDEQTLYDEVVCIEQKIATGGGWGDPVGGLVPGIKLATSSPGLPQRVQVEPLALSDSFKEALNERLVLIYTGQRRLAKDLHRRVMGRWMAREPEAVALLREISELAVAMRDALLAEDLDTLGELLTQHWVCNRLLYPDASNDYFDSLMNEVKPYVTGARLVGAGGGGFVLGIATEPWQGAMPREIAAVARRAVQARVRWGALDGAMERVSA